MAYDTRRHPLSECGLEVSLEEALHHLNWSWNECHLTDAEIRNMRTPHEYIDENAARLVKMLDEKEPGIVAQTFDEVAAAQQSFHCPQ